MKPNEKLYVLKDGEYFCNSCGEKLVGQRVSEAFTLDAPSVATAYSCQKRGCPNFGKTFVI
jgi:hypothetical protein